jgi:Lon-like protease
VANYSEYEAEERGQRLGRGWIMWLVAAIIVAVLIALGSAPSGYVIEKPGPVFDTLGTTEVDGDTIPLVDIPLRDTYPTTGSLSMLTVTTVGNRTRTANWLTVVESWFNPSQDVLPLDDVYPPGLTTAEESEISAAQMTLSQQRAVAAALTVLGEEYTTSVVVVATTDGGPSEGVLEAGDAISAINAQPVSDLAQVRSALDDNGTADPATITITRDAVSQDVQVTPEPSDTGAIIGVEITSTYDFPFEVSVQLDDVGGPSAGQIFALAIIDKLTPGPLTGGLDFAGTGTITDDGTIGPIGGIRQKMHGASAARAEYFLAPTANCDEVIGNIPDGLTVFAVGTLADSLAVLNTLSTGASTAMLPRCEP